MSDGHTLEATTANVGPVLEGSGNSYRYRHGQGIIIVVKGTRLHSDGRLTGVIHIHSEAGLRIPGSGVVNLSAPRTRAGMASDLERDYPLGTSEWARILDDLYLKLNERLTEGEPAEEIDVTTDVPLAVQYLIDPLLPLGMPTIFYGLGGVGKGWMALLLSRAVATGDVPNGFPIEVNQQGKVLYLDWETSKEDIRYRWSRVLGNGGGPRLTYRRCSYPLVNDIDYLTAVVLAVDPVLVVIDSAGLAAGGDLNSPETAIEFFRGIRALNRTSLIVAHAPKNSGGSVFGSVYFTNLARSVWELQSFQIHLQYRKNLRSY